MPRFATASMSPRANTEDRALVLPIGGGCVIALADGTGGISGGARAAEMFVDGVRRSALAGTPADGAGWSALLERIDQEIAESPDAGETTGVALAISAGLIVGASCGDSRAHVLTASVLRELTRDQARKPRLGTGRAKARAFNADARGVLVVGTDGLFDYAKLDDIARVLASPEGDAEGLIRLVLARHRTLPDDIAVVVGWLDE